MASLNFACVLFLCMIAIVPIAQASITCAQVSNNVLQCVTYLRGTGASPPPANCCQGVKNLNGMAKTTPDRQSACNCLKTAASEISGLNPTLVANLPKNCGVNIPYKISTSTDCSKVK
ncbi:non-specific lipid-transfer protein 1-like [Quercus lobata]|uniref:non-specific lipid-transfer protein 1-like n=1 Tax=Quercus lobata TaxID=97700 RepID=UPI001248C1B3|nr:non-specific lipid-transfer protein 1-like [Quercus lobata]